MLAFLNENAFVWTGLDVSTKKNNGLCQPIIHQSLFSLVIILSFLTDVSTGNQIFVADLFCFKKFELIAA